MFKLIWRYQYFPLSVTIYLILIILMVILIYMGFVGKSIYFCRHGKKAKSKSSEYCWSVKHNIVARKKIMKIEKKINYLRVKRFLIEIYILFHAANAFLLSMQNLRDAWLIQRTKISFHTKVWDIRTLNNFVFLGITLQWFLEILYYIKNFKIL